MWKSKLNSNKKGNKVSILSPDSPLLRNKITEDKGSGAPERYMINFIIFYRVFQGLLIDWWPKKPYNYKR